MLTQRNSLKNQEVAEILGAFIGDGWIENRRDALYIAGSPTEDKDHYDNFIAPIFSKYFVEVKPRNFLYWSVYGITTYRKPIIKKAIDLGFQVGKKCYIAKIPSWIMNSNDKEIIKAVLRGIFDTDGSFYCKKAYGKYDKPWTKEHHCKPRIVFQLTSEILINQINVLLKILKIACVKYSRKAENRLGKNHSAVFILHINKLKCIGKWFQFVGSNNARHQTRYDVWKKLGYLPPYTTIEDRRNILN